MFSAFLYFNLDQNQNHFPSWEFGLFNIPAEPHIMRTPSIIFCSIPGRILQNNLKNGLRIKHVKQTCECVGSWAATESVKRNHVGGKATEKLNSDEMFSPSERSGWSQEDMRASSVWANTPTHLHAHLNNFHLFLLWWSPPPVFRMLSLWTLSMSASFN